MIIEGTFRSFKYTISKPTRSDEVWLVWTGPRAWYEELRRGATIWSGSKIDMPIEEFWDKLDIGRSTAKTN